MGNCMQTLSPRQRQSQKQEEEEAEKETGSGFVKGTGLGKQSMRVKIVVTKEELQWLMLQLNNSKGSGKSLEDVLEEIEKSRGKADQGWKPSLESIVE